MKIAILSVAIFYVVIIIEVTDMFEKFAEDVVRRYQEKLAALEKAAASNLRSDLVLGRLSDATKNTLMSTPRYSKTNPSQILADIRSSLRGRGNNVGALTSELTKRDIPYKVRGKGLSPKDIELDLSKGHAILNTPYLPSNYNESFANNNVNRRFRKAVDAARNAGYNGVNVYNTYGSPRVERLPYNKFSGRPRKNIDLQMYIPIEQAHIPAEQVNNGSQLQFEQGEASTILHEINELNRMIQNDKQYNRIIKSDQSSPLYTSGKYPGVMQSPNTAHIKAYGGPKNTFNMFDEADPFELLPAGPYNNTGYNNHESATILMNEIMDHNSTHVSKQLKPGDLDDIWWYRKQGPDNPVNRITGIDLTSREQPFVPRDIAKNKGEYLKRIREVRKAEDALQREYLTRNSLLSPKVDFRTDPRLLELNQIPTLREYIKSDFRNAIMNRQARKQRKQYNDFLINYLRSRGIPVE